jgi:hypothetical protein
MKCQNKREQLSKQYPIIARISLHVILNKTNVVSEQIRARVETSYYYRQNNLLL